MAWASNKTADRHSEEFQRFREDDEKEQFDLYLQLLLEVEQLEAAGYPTTTQKRKMNKIGVLYPQVLERVTVRLAGRVAEAEQTIARKEKAKELTSQHDLSVLPLSYERAYEYTTTNADMLRYTQALNTFLESEPETEYYLDTTSQHGEANSRLMGRYVVQNHMSAGDPRSWAIAFEKTKVAMTPVKALPRPAPDVVEEPKHEPKVFSQTITVKTPWGTLEPKEVITGAEYWDEDGERIRMTGAEVNQLLENDPAEYRKRFVRSTAPTAMMR